MECYRSGGCGPYEMYSCSECPASRPEYVNRGVIQMDVKSKTMTIADVKDRIVDLQYDRENFMKIQEYCLGHLSESNDEEHIKIYEALEDDADLNISLRNLASKTVRNIDAEIDRLNRIIDSAVVNID